nr:MAG TPA: hypothetical protein [Caudoviricetes sp.]
MQPILKIRGPLYGTQRALRAYSEGIKGEIT